MIFTILLILFGHLCSCIAPTTDDSSIQSIARNFGLELEIIKDEELGAVFAEKFYEKFQYFHSKVDSSKIVKNMANNLEWKINNTFSALLHTKNAVEHLYNSGNITNIRSSLIPCFKNENENELPVKDFKTAKFIDSDILFEKLTSNMWNMKSLIIRRFLILSSDLEDSVVSPFSHCNQYEQISLWRNYMNRYKYRARNVIILIDNGNFKNQQQMTLTKAIAKEMLENLSEEDSVAVIAVSSKLKFPHYYQNCSFPENPVASSISDITNMVTANDKVKQTYINFVESVSAVKEKTNVTLGFEQVFKLIELSEVKKDDVMVFYVTSGVLSSFEAESLLQIISGFNSSFSVVINICVVFNDLEPNESQIQIFQEITNPKYNTSKPGLHKKGLLMLVNSTSDVGFVVTQVYKQFSKKFDLEKHISLPALDNLSKELTISLSLGCFLGETFGLLGVDLDFSNLAEDIIYFRNPISKTYTFLLDVFGRTLMHPVFPRPVHLKNQLHFVDIKYLENTSDFETARAKILSEPRGMVSLNHSEQIVKYTWQRVLDWYIICVVSRDSFYIPRKLYKSSWLPEVKNYNLFYHHLEKSEGGNLCQHFGDLATLDASSLYLAASCFKPPSTILKLLKDKLLIQEFMVYLKNESNTNNPGLKEHIKDDVAALAHIIEYLRNQHLSGSNLKYILRRYVATFNGVLQVFPGMTFPSGYDPTRRYWYLKAKQFEGKVIFTPPYLDNSGGGYISTVAYSSLNIVLAMDVTFGYVLKLLLGQMVFCSNSNITCFIMDDRGYLVYHPNLIDTSGDGPIEQLHIVHKESLVANDLLNHQHFIKKNLCVDYPDGKVERFYQLNTSFSDVLFNYVPGEHCVHYKITSISNTNLFIGIVNASCEVVSTFCPCSVVDRLCLNCNRMEQKECECPCECPLNLNSCHNQTFNNSELCKWRPESYPVNSIKLNTPKEKPCFPISCEIHTTFSSCLGVIDCEWCKFDLNGNPLQPPFCSKMSNCFNGILGSRSPYKSSVIDPSIPTGSTYLHIGPVLGFILALCILAILLFICYRSYSASHIDRVYLSSIQDNHLRMSDLNVSDNYHNLNSHRDKLLQDEKPNPVSPYCVTSSYRKAIPAADSDHGYSTMTPHDESEQLSLAPLDIDQEDDFISDNTSVSTTAFGKHINRPKMADCPEVQKPFTQILNRNCIVVPVTVHRNMEIT